MAQEFSRRSLLQGAGAASAAWLGRGLLQSVSGTQSRTRALRAVHFTDPHIFADERGSDEGIAWTVDQIQTLDDAPELVLYGGDSLTGLMRHPAELANSMRARWERAYKANMRIPTLYCAGNHDIWGWNNNAISPSEPLYGKNFSRDMFELDDLTYSVEQAGWKFIVLDGVQQSENLQYEGGLTDQDFEWLEGEVQGDIPTVVLSHIQITGMAPLVVDGRPEEDSIGCPHFSLYRDMFRIIKLFEENPNVKLVLGGHTHFRETAEFHGCTYHSAGAVCGTWWIDPVVDGARRTGEPRRLLRAAPGYTLIDLYTDGTFDLTEVDSGWESLQEMPS